MAHVDQIIRPPVVTPEDIAAILGIAGTDLATLCQSDNINMWAKYKPIKHSAIGILTETQIRNANYGITNIPVWTGPGAINKMGNFWFGIDTTSTNYPVCGIQPEYWKYNKPTGGTQSPFRLSDFAKESGSQFGYKHDVVAPIGYCTLSSIRISATGYITIPFSGNGSGQTEGYTVPINELSGDGVYTGLFGTLYMSVMIHKKNTNIYYVASREDNWGTDPTTTVTRTITSASDGLALEGTCEVFPFLSTVRFQNFTQNLSGETGPVVAMFEKNEVAVWIEYAVADISNFVAYYQNTTDKYLYYGFSLTNNSCQGGFRAAYTVYFSPQSTFPDSDTVTAVGNVYIAYGATEQINASRVLPEQTASHYVGGYARIIVQAQAGYDIMFTRQTSDQANITQGPPR